jgi:hypothetical protein
LIKKFLFDGKSIRKGKDIIKKKNRVKGNGTEGVFWKKWEYQGLEFTK